RYLPDLKRRSGAVGCWAKGPAFELRGGCVRLGAFGAQKRQMVVSMSQRAAQVAVDGCLDDTHARVKDGRAEIVGAINLAREAHTVEVTLGEAAIAGRAALDRR